MLLIAGYAILNAPMVRLPTLETMSSSLTPSAAILELLAPSPALAPAVLLIAGSAAALWALGWAADREIRAG